jgi:hypothetical protein
MLETLDIVTVDLDNDIVANDGPMSALQQALVKRLQQEAHYAPVTILYENSLELLNEIDRALAELGIAILIMTPEWKDESPNIPTVILDDLTVVAEVQENPLINRSESGSRIPGGVIAWRCAKDLAQTKVNGAMLIHTEGRQEIDQEKGTVNWKLTFKTSLNV